MRGGLLPPPHQIPTLFMICVLHGAAQARVLNAVPAVRPITFHLSSLVFVCQRLCMLALLKEASLFVSRKGLN